MSLSITLKRVGKKNQLLYKVVVKKKSIILDKIGFVVVNSSNPFFFDKYLLRIKQIRLIKWVNAGAVVKGSLCKFLVASIKDVKKS